jgi:hypothetical protein
MAREIVKRVNKSIFFLKVLHGGMVADHGGLMSMGMNIHAYNGRYSLACAYGFMGLGSYGTLIYKHSAMGLDGTYPSSLAYFRASQLNGS